jgi:undecaprenyl-diphosphatase
MKALFDLGSVPILFDVLLHVATLLVVLVVFRQRVISILKSLFRWIARRADDSDADNLRLTWVIILVTVITGAIGFAIDRMEWQLPPRLVSGFFIVTALALIGTRFLHGTRDFSQIGVRDGIIVGLGQAAGVFPGISRSGITISAGMAAGLDREKAGELAFLVFIPAILGALLLTISDAAELSGTVDSLSLVVAFVAALVVGMVSLLLLVRLIRRGRLYLFSLYLIPLGIAGIILL